MFTMCKDLWHTLSATEQKAWEALARPFHMTGYAYYISQCLRPNPGIYLPLAGGTMSGHIDMATSRIKNLPSPGDTTDPARLADLTAHAALITGVHGLKGRSSFHAYLSPSQSIPTATTTKVQYNQLQFDYSGDFDTTNHRHTPTISGVWCYIFAVYLSTIPDQSSLSLYLRQNSVTVGYPARDFASGNSTLYFAGLQLLEMNGSTDYAEVFAYHNSGSNETLYSGYYRNYFQGFLVTPSS